MRRVWLVGLGLALSARAEAVETQFWIADSPQDYNAAEARGVRVAPDGSLVMGVESTKIESDSSTIYWSVAILGDGSVALGSGQQGRIDRWEPGKGIRPWVKLGSGQVFCLARDGNQLLAGTGPHGLVYRIGANGDTTLVARTGERYVWALARGTKGWYAATGTRGRLLLIDGGRVRTVFDSDESNLVSLTSDGHGGVFAGGDSQGHVIHARADGSIRTVFDATENEVRALAVGGDGALYAAALSATAAPEDDREEEPKPAKSTSGRSTIYRIVPDSVVTTYWSVPQPMVFALAPRGGDSPHLLAATGNRAALYRVDAPGAGTLLFSAPVGQLTAIALDAQGNAFIAGSNPGVLYRVGAAAAKQGTLTSGTLDARRYARFGRIRWRGDLRGGRVRLQTRSGNTDPPDSTWSPWRGTDSGQSHDVLAPPARYLQWRAQLERGSGAGPRVESVEVAYREQNLPPKVEDVSVAPQGAGYREGEMTPHSEPVTQSLPGGQRVEFSLRQTDARGIKVLPEWVRGLRVVQWKGSDPNGDDLVYRIEFQREGETEWHEIVKDLDVPSYAWDTNALPDGRYRIRVVASDAPANGINEGLETTFTSRPFTIDNTPPEVLEVTATAERDGVRVRGRARDAASVLTRLEIGVDGDAWKMVSPAGGLADDSELTFQTTLKDLAPGDHSLSVRAVDAAGNSATRATTVRVPHR